VLFKIFDGVLSRNWFELVDLRIAWLKWSRFYWESYLSVLRWDVPGIVFLHYIHWDQQYIQYILNSLRFWFFLYVMYTMILAAIPMGVISIFKPIVVTQVISGMKAWFDGFPRGYRARQFGRMKDSDK